MNNTCDRKPVQGDLIMEITHKIHCHKVRINSQGYTSDGEYFGVGKPLYHVQVLAQVSCPISLPKRIVEPMMHEPGGYEYWQAKSTIEKWNEPYSEYFRAWDRDVAIIIARPAIGLSIYRLACAAKVVDKHHHIHFENEAGK